MVCFDVYIIGEVFAYGEYDVMYIAYDSENNTAVCSFTVYVIRK